MQQRFVAGFFVFIKFQLRAFIQPLMKRYVPLQMLLIASCMAWNPILCFLHSRSCFIFDKRTDSNHDFTGVLYKNSSELRFLSSVWFYFGRHPEETIVRINRLIIKPVFFRFQLFLFLYFFICFRNRHSGIFMNIRSEIGTNDRFWGTNPI